MFRGKVFVMLFFDDGYKEDIYVAKILRRKGLKAHFAVTIKNIGKELNKDELSYLSKTGEILSHGVLHLNLVKALRNLGPNIVYQEIKRFKEILERILELPVEGFCYPYGVYNNYIKTLVEKAGYRYARGTDIASLTPAIRDPYAIPVTVVDMRASPYLIIKSLIRNTDILSAKIKLIRYFNLFRANHTEIMRLILKFIIAIRRENLRLGVHSDLLLRIVFHTKYFTCEDFKIFEKIVDVLADENYFVVLTLSDFLRNRLYKPYKH